MLHTLLQDGVARTLDLLKDTLPSKSKTATRNQSCGRWICPANSSERLLKPQTAEEVAFERLRAFSDGCRAQFFSALFFISYRASRLLLGYLLFGVGFALATGNVIATQKVVRSRKVRTSTRVRIRHYQIDAKPFECSGACAIWTRKN